MSVIDDVENRRFVFATGAGTAQLVYRTDGDRLLLVHTEVPGSMGGQGIGGRLVEAAVDRARASGETLVPSCSFVRGWLAKHPDQASTVAVDLSGAAG